MILTRQARSHQDAATSRLDAFLTTHGLTRDSVEWRELGLTSVEVDRFLKGEKPPKTSKKAAAKAQKDTLAWTDPGSGVALKSADDAIGMLRCCIGTAVGIRGSLTAPGLFNSGS